MFNTGFLKLKNAFFRRLGAVWKTKCNLSKFIISIVCKMGKRNYWFKSRLERRRLVWISGGIVETRAWKNICYTPSSSICFLVENLKRHTNNKSGLFFYVLLKKKKTVSITTRGKWNAKPKNHNKLSNKYVWVKHCWFSGVLWFAICIKNRYSLLSVPIVRITK